MENVVIEFQLSILNSDLHDKEFVNVEEILCPIS